jgi:arylsulfatase
MQAKPNGFCGKKTAHDRTPTSAAPMNGYPRVFSIEADPREEHNIGEMYEWVAGPLLKAVEEYKASVAKFPNPPAANMTRF